MNRFAIFCLFGSFCISFAAEYKPYCEVRAVYDDDTYFYRHRAVIHLYKRIDGGWGSGKYYKIQDVSGKSTGDFVMAQHNVAVTDDCICIKYGGRDIQLLLMEGQDTFKFYRDLNFDLRNFTKNYPVVKVYRDNFLLRGVSVIKAKDAGAGAWIIVAFDGNSPRLICPRKNITPESFDINDKIVFFSFEATLKKIEVEFATSAVAVDFFRLITAPN